MNAIKKIVMGLAVACAAVVLPAMADGVSISSAEGQITVTIAADTVAASTPVYLAWDTADKGGTLSAWAHSERIGTVSGAGGVFNINGDELGLTDGEAIRAFVATGEIAFYSALTKPKDVEGLIRTGYIPGVSKHTSGVDIDLKFLGTKGSGTGSFYGVADSSPAALLEANGGASRTKATSESFSSNFGSNDPTSMHNWVHAYNHVSYDGKTYQFVAGSITPTIRQNRNTFKLRTGAKPKYGSLTANADWPAAPTWDYDVDFAVFGQLKRENDGSESLKPFGLIDMTLYCFRVYEKPESAHVCVREYVPAEIDGVKGLYETMNATFHPVTAEGFTFEGSATNTVSAGSSASDAATYKGGIVPMTAQVTGATGSANGTAYSCALDVTVPSSGYTALWYDGSDYTLDAAPTHTAEGVYEDSVKVTKAGYYDFYGTGVVTVTAMPESFAVSAGGDDETGDGTPDKPFATIAKGIAAAKAAIGDSEMSVKIMVADGDYDSPFATLNKAIQIIGNVAHPENVTINDATQGERAFTLSHEDAKVAGVRITGSGQRDSLSTTGGHVNMSAGTVEDCIIADGQGYTRGFGGNVYMTGGRLCRCRVQGGRNGANTGNLGANIYATGGVIENCLVTGGRTATDSTTDASVDIAGAVKVVNGTIVAFTPNSAGYGGIHVTDSGAQIVDCVFYGNGGTPAKEWGKQNAACFINCAVASEAKISGDTGNIDTVTADAFADYPNGDYHLAAGSVLKGAGVTKSEYNTYGAISDADLVGTLWGKTLDIGCYAAKAAGLMLILR